MKTVKRGILALALTLTLCLGVLPLPVSAADLYFTALNERVELLTSDSMPFWYGGSLYVPYSVFDKDLNTTQIFLGLNVSYNSRTRSTVTIYNLRQQMLTFDLNSGTCMDELTGETYDARAIMRNGKPYLPVATVCAYFGLNWSYTALSSIPDGYLVRITNSDVVLDDATFIDAAGNTLDARLQQYTQSLNSAASTTPAPTPTPTQPVEPQPEGPISPNDIPPYLAVLGREGDGLRETLDALDAAGRYALFFLTPRRWRRRGIWCGGCWGRATWLASWPRGRTRTRPAPCWSGGQLLWRPRPTPAPPWPMCRRGSSPPWRGKAGCAGTRPCSSPLTAR